MLDNLEEVFVTSDVGVDTTLRIIDRIQKRVARDKYVGSAELNRLLCEEIADMLAENSNESSQDDFTVPASHKPHVIMVVGVNGVGKTTTIGKMAAQFKKAGNKVMLGAADTFRAAAIEQLEEWGRRADVPVIKQKLGADPASVAFDTLQSAIANNADVVIIDTAGRLHNKKGLMDELTKVKNVMQKLVLPTKFCSCLTAPPDRTPSSRPASLLRPLRSMSSRSLNLTVQPKAEWSSESAISSRSRSNTSASAKALKTSRFSTNANLSNHFSGRKNNLPFYLAQFLTGISQAAGLISKIV